jgi:hypothetical protein
LRITERFMDDDDDDDDYTWLMSMNLCLKTRLAKAKAWRSLEC